MTEPPDLGLDKNRAAASLSSPARHVHLAILAGFVETGGAPRRSEVDRVARHHGVEPDLVLAELTERDVVALDADGEIRAAYPFSPAPTPIRVSWTGGPLVYAMCAVDALGISTMLDRPVVITATEPGSGRPVTVEVDRSRATWQPDTAVVYAGTAGDACCPSADRTCGHINFFVSEHAARAWADQNPDVPGVMLSQSEALACGMAEFGTLMRSDPARPRGA